MGRPAAWRAFAIDLEEERPFRVGRAAIDPVSREAQFIGGRERLQPQTLKVLIALVRRRGEVVTRSELVDSCWNGRIVGEDVINHSISMLRDFAGRAGGFSIETIPKTGYRLVKDIEFRKGLLGALRWALPVALLLAMAIVAWLFPAWRNSAEPSPPMVALKHFTSSTDPSSRDLAAASADALSHMMLAGTFHGKLAWPATASDETAADLVMSGDVRRTADQYAALVQVRDRRTGTVLFSRRFEVPVANADLLPEQIGAEFSSNLTGALALMVLDRRYSESPDITAETLKQIASTVAGEDPLNSYQISRRIAQNHPNSLIAQIGLAYDTAFALGSLPRHERPEAVRKARIAAENALRIAPDFGDTYAPWCLLHPKTESLACEDRLRAGMKADPDAPFTPVFLSDLLFDVGRFEESSQVARAALTGHPYHPHKLRRVVRTMIVLGQKEEAEALFAKAVRWWPNHGGLHWDRLYGYAIRGDMEGAERAIGQLPPALLDETRVEISSMLAAYRAHDRYRLRAICTNAEAGYLLRNFCLTALYRLNDRESALVVAEKLFPRAAGATVHQHVVLWLDAPHIGIEPMLSSPAAAWLRTDPHFFSFAQRTGALHYWRSGRLPDFCRVNPEPICGAILRSKT